MMKQSEPGKTTCQDQPGQVIPVIDPNRCENKGPCVTACPYDVLGIRPLLPLAQTLNNTMASTINTQCT